MTDHVFDPVAFRKAFRAFTSELKYPDEQLSGYFSMATAYIYPHDWAMLHGPQMQLALELMTAHLAWSDMLIMQGNTSTGIITGAGIDKVSVSLQAPPVKSAWQHWLATTPYGMRLWVLLRTLSRGGFVTGGLPERNAFRNVYGIHGAGRMRLR